jgi:hypothetical protein
VKISGVSEISSSSLAFCDTAKFSFLFDSSAAATSSSASSSSCFSCVDLMIGFGVSSCGFDGSFKV